ncbi:hypothetical protein D3C74_380210 [compost metagenome]
MLRYAVEPCRVHEVIQCRPVLIEPDVIRQITNLPLNLKRLARRIESADSCMPRGRFGQPEHHQDRCGFPCAIGTKQSENLPAGDAQIQMIDSCGLAVFLGQLHQLDDRMFAVGRWGGCHTYTGLSNHGLSSPVFPEQVIDAATNRQYDENPHPSP